MVLDNLVSSVFSVILKLGDNQCPIRCATMKDFWMYSTVHGFRFENWEDVRFVRAE